MQKNSLASYFISLTKVNSTWIKDLNIRHENIKLLEENIREKLLDTGLGNDFFGYDIKSTSEKRKKFTNLYTLRLLITGIFKLLKYIIN